MNRIKQATVATKNFVVRHKTGLAVTTTAALLIWANRAALNDHKEFIAQQGLTDEFITYMSGE